MTSGKFDRVDPTKVIVSRDTRQRSKLRRIEELADSIRRRGQINPITVTRDLELITGERRLTAIRDVLQLPYIYVQYIEELDEKELKAVELEENVRQDELDWQDRCHAIYEYHKLHLDEDATWTPQQTADALGYGDDFIRQKLEVCEALLRGDEYVIAADKYSVARGLVQRQKARAATNILDTIEVDEEGEFEEISIGAPPLINADIHEWLSDYTGPPFNFIHCDFPYGIGYDKHRGQNSANIERYDDSPEVYRRLVLEALPRIPITESAHLMFWFSMKHYAWTKIQLQAQGWKVHDWPLVWGRSDNSGLLPDHQREGRRGYEVAFHCTKGDRAVVKPVTNIWWGARGEAIHSSTKPREMLRHFFRMFVDGSTHMLDPTCGSGNSVKMAIDAGAARALGIECNPTYYADAVRHWDT